MLLRIIAPWNERLKISQTRPGQGDWTIDLQKPLVNRPKVGKHAMKLMVCLLANLEHHACANAK